MLRQPFVSFHVPICSEPPEVVAKTLRSLSRVDYDAFEVLVIDNNTSDERLWRPIETLCRELGPRFRFFHLPSWPGFKAGALNYALQHTAVEASVVGIVDADYEVAPEFLTDILGYFENDKIAFVQTPQDYRDWLSRAFTRICYWEYWQVFAVSMALRDKRNAILLHGTMSVVRKDAINRAGGWAEWCLTEDLELGLRLLSEGGHGIYVTKTYGRGLVPFTFRDYIQQRRRWVIGGVQQLKHHVFYSERRDLNHMSAMQKLSYSRWWLHWVNDGIITMAAPLSLVTAVLVLGGLVEPSVFWSLAIGLLIVLFQVILRVIIVYWLHLSVSWRDALCAMIANCSLTWTIGCAWFVGFTTANHVFQRTPKQPHGEPSWIFIARDETIFGVAMLLFGIAIAVKLGPEGLVASVTLWIYSLFFLPALWMAWLGARA